MEIFMGYHGKKGISARKKWDLTMEIGSVPSENQTWIVKNSRTPTI
jgi:hypothetical protein